MMDGEQARRVVAITSTLAALAAGCHPVEAPGVPLYPNGATIRLPRDQIAQLYGPIEKVDGQKVAGEGNVFDLLPGCHIVELERRLVVEGYAPTMVYWTGQVAATYYALRMKPGARYIIRRVTTIDAHLSLTAREEEASGAAADLHPIQSPDDVKDCRAWQRAQRG